MNAPRRLTPERYGELFHAPAPAALALGDSVCQPAFSLAALAYYVALTRPRLTLFCGPGARHAEDLFREHLDRLTPTPRPPTRRLDSREPIDVAMAAEELVEAATGDSDTRGVLALLSATERTEIALWSAIETEAARRSTARS